MRLGFDPQSTLLMSASSYFRTGNIILDSILLSLLGTVVFYCYNSFSKLMKGLKGFSWREFWLQYKLNSYQQVKIRYEQVLTNGRHHALRGNYHEIYVMRAIFNKIKMDGQCISRPYENISSFETHNRGSMNKQYKKGDLQFLPINLIQYRDFYLHYRLNINKNEGSQDKQISYEENQYVIIYHPTNLQAIYDFIRECIDEYTDIKWPEREYKPIYAIKYSYKIWEKYDKLMSEKGERAMNEFFYYDFKPRKTREDVFFPDRDLLFDKYEQFLEDEKQDKFCVLLTGLPGVGKTSLIEAFAKEFDLSVIESRIDDFCDDQELLDFFHNERIYKREKNLKEGQSQSYITIPLDKRLYVFEDFDTSSRIVLDRKKFQFAELQQIPDVCLLDEDDSSESLSESDEEKEESPATSSKGSPKKKKMEGPEELDFSKMKKSTITRQIMNSKITLKSLLNVFGGILKLQKSVIFITTNHPEVLDPALIRPGRVNYRIDLGPMIQSDKRVLVKHLTPMVDLENQGLQELLEQCDLLPCQLEQYCRLSENTQDLIQKLGQHLSMQHSEHYNKPCSQSYER